MAMSKPDKILHFQKYQVMFYDGCPFFCPSVPRKNVTYAFLLGSEAGSGSSGFGDTPEE